MFGKFYRSNNIVAGILTIIRVYWGYLFLTAGWQKITGGFDANGYLANAVAKPVVSNGEPVFGWYVSFLESFALPNVELFNVVVPWGEFLVGLGLILGCLTTAAAFFGMVMNFAFLLAGTISHNPTDIIMGILIVSAGYNAGKFGLDRWVLPYCRTKVFKIKSDELSA
ncbi:DoxX family protein [Tumebacillus lipolyticus]|uniref:DoxX family protein n=1 Tax=Tumebacillus lipolyticus TaxID=1280370 RepID=A0ABW4ZWW1_9BACL